MKAAILVTTLVLITSSAFAHDSKKVSNGVVGLLVRQATTITLVDREGKALPKEQQLPALIADSLTTGYEDAAPKGTTFVALAQTTVECKSVAANTKNCEVYFMTTDFNVAMDGYDLTKQDDASGAWVLDVKIKKQGNKWTLADKRILAFYAD